MKGDSLKMKNASNDGLTPLEIIPYGEVTGYQGIVSVCEFYDRLGLLARLESGEISSVSQLWMCSTDHWALEQLILKGLLRKNHGRPARMIRTTAMMDWLNLAPGQNDAVPRGELWIMARRQN